MLVFSQTVTVAAVKVILMDAGMDFLRALATVLGAWCICAWSRRRTLQVSLCTMMAPMAVVFAFRHGSMPLVPMPGCFLIKESNGNDCHCGLLSLCLSTILRLTRMAGWADTDRYDKKVGSEWEMVTILRHAPPCSISYHNRGKLT